MSVAKVCTSTIEDPGQGGCSKTNPFLDPVMIVLTTEGFQFDTVAEFATESNWQAGIDAQTVFPLQDIQEYEDQSEEPQYYEAPGGKRIKRRDGKPRYMFKFDYDFETHKKLQSFNGMDARLYIGDADGNIRGHNPSTTVVKGMKTSMVSVEKMKEPGQDGTPAFTVVVIDLDDPKQWNENGVYVNPTWDIESLTPLSTVTLGASGSTSASAFACTVYYVDGYTTAGAANNIPITGLLEEDFELLKTDGTANASPTGFTDNGDGSYSFTFDADLVTGTIDLVDPDTITDGLDIISGGSLAITVS